MSEQLGFTLVTDRLRILYVPPTGGWYSLGCPPSQQKLGKTAEGYRASVQSNCHSEMARAIGIGTTETQRATPRNYADADGRDRRRREAAATALRMVSKMPRQTMTNT